MKLQKELNKALKHLEDEYVNYIQKFCLLSFEELYEKGNLYYEVYKNLENSNKEELTKIHYLKYLIIDEAITVKRGNEEQAWDFLS